MTRPATVRTEPSSTRSLKLASLTVERSMLAPQAQRFTAETVLEACLDRASDTMRNTSRSSF